MPTIIRQLTPRGLMPVAYTAESLADAAQHEPADGIYTVTNTYYTTQVLKLDAHFDRMQDSAARADLPLTLDRARLRSALRGMILTAGYADSRFRITVGRAQPDHFTLTLEPYTPPSAELVEQGVRVVTAPDSARENPAAKTTGWMHDRHKLDALLTPGIYDVILLDAEGALLEGLAANFYAIIDGELRTAGAGVLPGIAQQIVFDIAPDILPLVKQASHISDLARIAEAFITSSSRGIIPVVEIDGVTLGDGTPGAQTRALRQAYAAWVEAHLEEL